MLEFKPSFDAAIPLYDDVIVGPCLRRMVPTPHESQIRRNSNRFCQSSESCYCQTGRISGFSMGWRIKKNECEKRVETKTTGRVQQAVESRVKTRMIVRLRDTSFGHLPSTVCSILCCKLIYISA